MKKKIITILTPLALVGYMMFQGGCIKENFDTIPLIKDSSTLVTTASIAEIKAITNTTLVKKVKDLATTTPLWQTIQNRNTASGVADITSIVIEGFVTTSDSTGNFYEVFTIQDATGGIDFKVNTSDLYTTYRLKPGQKVKIKLNDLYLGYYKGIYQFGGAIVELGIMKLVGLPPAELNRFVERTGFRKKLIPDTVTLAQLNNSYIQKLVCIKDVQFKDPFNAFSIPGVNTNRTLVDCSGNNTLILRTSGFATFAQDMVPSGNGTITGVLSYYDPTKQLYIRDLSDIKFTKPRCGAVAPTPNTTIAQLKAMYTSGLMPITTNVVISGVIVANDKGGNVYHQLFIQDDNSGIEFKIYISGLYPEYPVGTRVVINCNGLYLGFEKGAVKLGGMFNNILGYLDANLFYPRIFIVEAGVPVVPIATTIAALNDNLLHMLISLDDVQFIDSDLGKPWAESSAYTNRTLTDIYTNKPLENRLIVYTSNYADFTNNILPSGRGKFTAILTKFNSNYQLIVRDLTDIRLIKPRFNFILSQDFSLASLGSAITVGGWQTMSLSGTKLWTAKITSGNTYAEMNTNNSGEPSNIGWLISPRVNLAGYTSKTLVFQTAFNNWATESNLEAFISTNFDGTNVNSATWTPISGAHIVQQAEGANTWISSGNIDLNQYSGNIYIGFKYTSTGGVNATAFRVDNIKIY